MSSMDALAATTSVHTFDTCLVRIFMAMSASSMANLMDVWTLSAMFDCQRLCHPPTALPDPPLSIIYNWN
jgi:hypothetical protein